MVLAPTFAQQGLEEVKKMIEINEIEVGSYLVTMLSAIKLGLSRALDCWIEIGNKLDKLLGNEDLILHPDKHDRFCFYDGNDDHDDFSHAKKCFWIINSVTKFERSISDTLQQWKWFAN